MYKLTKLWLVFAVLFGHSQMAAAVIIVIDPDDHAVGTDLSHFYPGLSMSRLNQRASEPGPALYDPVRSPVLTSDNCYYTNTGCLGGVSGIDEWSECYGRNPAGSPSSACRSGWNVLELYFDSPTNLVQIVAAWGSDSPGMQAFDALGNEVGRCWSIFGSQSDCTFNLSREPDPRGNLMALTFDSIESNISRVVVGGVAGTVQVTEVLYRHSVPEPSTLGLAVLGVAGAAIARRRRGGAIPERGRSIIQ